MMIIIIISSSRSIIITSQVPQPTCYWKWVGVSIPQKVGNFSLRRSSTAIWRCSRLGGCLLSSSGSWLALTPMPNSHIHPVLLQRGIYVLLPIRTSSSSQSGFRDLIFLYCISHLNISYFSPEAYFSAVLTNSSVTLMLHSGDRLPLWDVFRNCPGPVLPVEDKTCTSLFWMNLLCRYRNRLGACTISPFRIWWRLLAIYLPTHSFKKKVSAIIGNNIWG